MASTYYFNGKAQKTPIDGYGHAIKPKKQPCDPQGVVERTQQGDTDQDSYLRRPQSERQMGGSSTASLQMS